MQDTDISQIHYRATWQELKDFVRNADPDHPINIEHAHIYEPNRGFGWVSILGESDFWKAYSELIAQDSYSYWTDLFKRSFEWGYVPARERL